MAITRGTVETWRNAQAEVRQKCYSATIVLVFPCSRVTVSISKSEGFMPERGPLVFLNYNQAALDAAYDQAAYAPNREQLIKRRISDSELARLHIGKPERIAYGPAEIERLDIYRTGLSPAPVFIFIHGGAWRSGHSKEFASPAELFLAAGAHYVVPDFAWVQDVGGSLMVLADQVCRAVAWVYENAARFGGDPRRLFLGGQSSGAHLAAVALTTDWPRDFSLPPDIIKEGVCISGMYDLTPVRLSARNRYVAFDDLVVAALSPVRHLDRLHAPLIVAYGTCETPEFQRQSREFAAAIENSGKRVLLIVGEHYNHFELPETLGNPYGLPRSCGTRPYGLDVTTGQVPPKPI
jgi:arylformamidase